MDDPFANADNTHERRLTRAIDTILESDRLTTDQIETWVEWFEDDFDAYLLWLAWHQNKINANTVATLIMRVWPVDDPFEHLDPDQWRTLFHAAGFVRDWAKADPPTAPITLYQIGKLNSRNEWAWHDEEALAELLTLRTRTYKLWTAQVPPENLLGHYTEDEDRMFYIVDPEGLDITEYGTNRKKPH